MDVSTLSTSRAEALEKWKEYKQAEKETANPLYKDMRKVYHQIKTGRKVIDITTVIPAGGVYTNEPYRHLPKMAIARADQKKIACSVSTDGTVRYEHPALGWGSKINIILEKALPEFTWSDNARFRTVNGEAPVPVIPPKYAPKKLLDDYYILWEVDAWKMIPSTDPWLLRRITKTIFVVLDGWDLTEIEKAVMAARL